MENCAGGCMVQENLAYVEGCVLQAARRAGRERGEVTLVAVSKTKPVSLLMDAYRAGIRDFGENRVQELLDKIPQMPADVRWHLIGHLQRNKVKSVIGRTALIHSVDSLRLAEEISGEAVRQGITADILLEVNVAGEESKFGCSVDETPRFAEDVARLPAIRVRGLMTVAPVQEDAEQNRLYFRKLKQLCVDIRQKNVDNMTMDILSMGMTGDYSVAIEEGATCVRVGTGIFGERHGI